MHVIAVKMKSQLKFAKIKKTDFKIRLRRINMEQWDEEEVWDAISVISSIRAKCSVFKREQRSKYHACSMAIRALREVSCI